MTSVDTPSTAASERTSRRAAGLTLGAAAVWVVLALANQGTTYHFAPFVVATAAPVSARLDCGRPLPWRAALRLAMAATAVAAVTTVALGLTDGLDGPALVGGSGAGETVLALVVGAPTGLLLAAAGRRARP